jgi:hypothetical protein
MTRGHTAGPPPVGGAYRNRAAHLTIRVIAEPGDPVDTSTVEVTLTGLPTC